MPADLARSPRLWLVPAVALALLASAAAVGMQPALATDPPVITGLQYTHGGTHLSRDLIIRGTGLAHPTAVYFGDTVAYFHKTADDTRIRAESPAHAAGTVNVRVETAAGKSAITTADRFTYVRPPKVTTVTPDRGHQRRTQTLTISGARFHKVSEIEVGYQSFEQFTVTGPDEVQVTVPPMSPGKWRVLVVNKYGRWLGKSVFYTAVHDSPPSDWTVADLPSPADRSRLWSIPAAMDCADVQDCAAVGYYRTRNKRGSDVQLNWSDNGVWSGATAPQPADAVSRDARVEHVSCGSAGNCVGVGYYDASDADSAGLIETLSGGSWAASRAPLPSSVPADTYAVLSGVDCTSDDVCVAVGQAGNGGGDLFIADNSGGTWDSQLAPLPPGVSGVVSHVAVSCGAPGSCVVAAAINHQGVITDVVDTLSGGTWTSADLPLPANAAASQQSFEGQVGVTELSCSSADFCAAGGQYVTDQQDLVGMLAVLHGTQWTSTQPEVSGGTGVVTAINDLSCAGEDTCLASGFSWNGVSTHAVPRTVVLTNDSWHSERPTTPLNGRRQANDAAGHRAVACGASGSCLYASGFRRLGIIAPLLDDYRNGSWSSTEGPFPTRLAMTAQPIGAWCDADASCVVIGDVLEHGPRESYRGYVQTRING